MRIVHITSVHPWQDTRIFRKMCRSLAARGHDVHLVATRDDTIDVQVVDGVTVHAVPRTKNLARRLAVTVPQVLATARKLEGDVYHFHDPEILPWALPFQRIVGRPVIYDAHEDLAAQALYAHRIPRFLRRVAPHGADVVERFVTARLAGTITVSDAIGRRFDHVSNRAIIRNVPMLGELELDEASAAEPETRFCYVGMLTPIRSIDVLVAAIDKVAEPYRLSLGGPWSPATFRDRVRQIPGWQRIDDHGILNRAEVGRLLSRSVAGLAVYARNPNYMNGSSNKLFEYMSMALPVIASDFPAMRSVIHKHDCGLLVDPDRAESVAEAMTWIIEHRDQATEMGRRGLAAVRDEYNWDTELERLVNFYQDNVRRQGASLA